LIFFPYSFFPWYFFPGFVLFTYHKTVYIQNRPQTKKYQQLTNPLQRSLYNNYSALGETSGDAWAHPAPHVRTPISVYKGIMDDKWKNRIYINHNNKTVLGMDLPSKTLTSCLSPNTLVSYLPWVTLYRYLVRIMSHWVVQKCDRSHFPLTTMILDDSPIYIMLILMVILYKKRPFCSICII